MAPAQQRQDKTKAKELVDGVQQFLANMSSAPLGANYLSASAVSRQG